MVQRKRSINQVLASNADTHAAPTSTAPAANVTEKHSARCSGVPRMEHGPGTATAVIKEEDWSELVRYPTGHRKATKFCTKAFTRPRAHPGGGASCCIAPF